MSDDVACQHSVGTKAFTGKGEAARRLRQCEVQVDKVHQRMTELSAATRKITARTFYLALHRRSGTGQVSLRWRRAGATGGHIAWQDMEQLFQRLPDSLKHWYRQINHAAFELNREEQMARSQLRYVKESEAREGMIGTGPHTGVPQ